MLHPSPPESPEEARFLRDEYDFVRRDFERDFVQTRGAASAESIDGSIDPLERVVDDRGSGLSRLIEDVREVRAEVARLKNAPFFAGADSLRLHSTRRVTGSSPY